VARAVREVRHDRCLSQRQLAGRMQVPRTYISKIENGKAVPTLSSLQRLATALEVGICDLLHDGNSRRARKQPRCWRIRFCGDRSSGDADGRVSARDVPEPGARDGDGPAAFGIAPGCADYLSFTCAADSNPRLPFGLYNCQRGNCSNHAARARLRKQRHSAVRNPPGAVLPTPFRQGATRKEPLSLNSQPSS